MLKPRSLKPCFGLGTISEMLSEGLVLGALTKDRRLQLA